MKCIIILSILLLAGCAWTDHHWDMPANATPDESQRVDLHNCQEEAIQDSRRNHDSAGEVFAIAAGGLVGGAIGGAAMGAASSNGNSATDTANAYVKKCMAALGY